MPLNINGNVITSTMAKVSNYRSIITRGLTYYLEASAAESIPETGTAWTDIIGNNGATLTNGAVWSSTNSGIVTLDGADDFVDCGNVVGSATSFTICSWVWPGSTQMTYADIFDNNHTGTQNWVCQQNVNNTNQYAFDVIGASSFSSTGFFTLAANTWVFLTFTWDNDRARGYINSSLFGTGQSAPGALTYNAPYLRLGRWAGGRFWNGRFGNWYYYNRALSAAEITQNYNAQRGRFGI